MSPFLLLVLVSRVLAACCAEIPRKANDAQQGSSGKGNARKANGVSPAAAAAPAMTAKEKAQAIIAACFKEVKQDMARKANAGEHAVSFSGGGGGGGGGYSASAGAVMPTLGLEMML